MLLEKKINECPSWCVTKPRLEEERVIIFHDKNDHQAFRYFNEEDLDYACIEICKQRELWYLIDESSHGKPPEAPEGLSRDMIETLPQALREEAENKLDDYEKRLKYWEHDVAVDRLELLVLKNNDAKAARKLIEVHKDYEYEGYTIERIISKDDKKSI